MARTHPWLVSDALWEQVAPLLPDPPSRTSGGRPRLPDRQVFGAIVYVLRTGCQWNALPRSYGSSSTVHARFQEWERAGAFRRLWETGLAQYDELVGIAWEWQAVDGAMTKAPFGGAATGPNPTDRGKSGTKQSTLTDGAGIPLAVVVDGANRHDMKLLTRTLDQVQVPRPATDQHLCLDAGYDYPACRAALVERGLQAHIRPQGTPPERQPGEVVHPARRYVVERTHSWLNRSRRLLVRWEKKAENYLAFIHLACARLLFNRMVSG